MPRYTQPRRTWCYTTDFKIKAVKLSLQEGIQVKQVAEGLDIHPFMLSRWRKEYRDGKLHLDGQRRTSVTKKKRPSKELTELERLKRDNAKLRKENDLLKKWQRYLAEQHWHNTRQKELSVRQQENPAFLSKQVLKKFTKAGSSPESS